MGYKPEELLQALLTLWDELPTLLGPAWPDVRHRLEWAVERWQVDGTPDSRDRLAQAIEEAFREHGSGWMRVVRACRASRESLPVQTRSPVRTRGTPPADYYGFSRPEGAGPTRGSSRPAAGTAVKELKGRLRVPTVVRYAEITCPDRVSLATDQVSVFVRLRVREPQAASGRQELSLRQEKHVQVRVRAPAFKVRNASRQETPILPNKDSPPLAFDLQPVKEGPTVITLDFFQGRSAMGTMAVPITILPDSAAEPATRQSMNLVLEDHPLPPDLVLLIELLDSPAAVQFTLLRDGATAWHSFSPVPLTGDPADFASQLYQKLTWLTVKNDPLARALGRPARLPDEQIDEQVENLGNNLWHNVIPQDFREYYARERHAWRNRSLLIIADEPYLPWEFVWPYGSGWKDDGPWCCTLRLTRWLRRNTGGPPLHLTLGPLAVLAPEDAHLPSAQEEKVFVRGLASKHGIEDISPPAADKPAVLYLLKYTPCRWVHVASHGHSHPISAKGDTVLALEQGTMLEPSDLVGQEIEDRIRQQRPAFLFNACQVGQQGRGLTRLAGWATQLLEFGAGLFMGPLWEITDVGALGFMEVFYHALLAGATVAEAVQKARLEARKLGDPTWAAYSVYAHPHARVFLRQPDRDA